MTTTQSTLQPDIVDARRSRGGGLANRYLWLAAALVVLFNGGILVFQSSRIPAIRSLKHPLDDPSGQFGKWKSEPFHSPQEIVFAVGADQLSERKCALDGVVVLAHRASWNSVDEWMPHEPDVCYTSQGWKIASQSTMALPQRPDVRIALRTYEQAGHRLIVAFWYQLGTHVYTDRDGARPARRAFWGQQEMPPLMKTLLQTQDPAAVPQLLALAGLIYDANCEL
jgi:Protein of unknown function (DUF3485)